MPASERRAIVRLAAEAAARMLTFDGRVESLGLEAQCRAVLAAYSPVKGEPPAFSPPWYAHTILEDIGGARAAIANGDANEAAVFAFDIAWQLALADLHARHERRVHIGKIRGQQLAKAAATHDLAIQREATRWQQSEIVQDLHRSCAAWVAPKVRRSRRTVERRLKILSKRPVR